MDAFYEYVGLNREQDVMEHTKAMVWPCIPGMKLSKEYDRKFYEAVDKAAKKVPLVDYQSGKVFDNLKDLATHFADEYEEYLATAANLPANAPSDYQKRLLEEDPSIYLAVTCGI